ncbi:MAG TPA: hypothetical protein VMT61_02395 [Candidatus Binataceae bacterium]|nr:hypothetical protein [Candidatus Binataceae bacterium]
MRSIPVALTLAIGLIALALPPRANAQTSPNLALDPPLVNGQPIKVAIGLTLINIPTITEAEEHFEITGYLSARWVDPRLAHKPRPDGLPVSYSPDQVWHPHPEIVNAIQPRQRQDVSIEADPDGTIHYLERFGVEVSSPFSLRSFPFDRQTLQIILHPFASNVQRVRFEIDTARTSNSAELKSYSSLAQWDVIGLTATQGTSKFNGAEISEARFEIQIVRRYQFYIWKVFLPLLLMVMLSWTIFWIETFDLQNQIQVAVVTLLTVIAFAFAISSNLPKVPYLTFADAFFLTCYVFVFIAILELMTVHVSYRTRGEHLGLKIRRVSRWLVPLAFCASLTLIAFRFVG